MGQYTSRELYMMNGGNKLYIYKDGFGDIYNATADEEATWSREVVENALRRIDTETNATTLRFAINDLIFHGYGNANIEALLLEKMEDASPPRKIVFAGMLWTIKGYEKSFAIIYQLFLSHGDKYLAEIFSAMQDFKDNTAARSFMLDCLSGDDDLLFNKAIVTLSMWAYTGMPELRAAGLLDELKRKTQPGLSRAIRELKLALYL